MHLDITLDEDSEKVSITYDDAVTVYSEINSKGMIMHRGYDKIGDDDTSAYLQEIAEHYLNSIR